MGQEVSKITKRLVRLPRVLWDLQMKWQGRDEVELLETLIITDLSRALPVTAGNGFPKPEPSPKFAPTIPQESYCHSLP